MKVFSLLNSNKCTVARYLEGPCLPSDVLFCAQGEGKSSKRGFKEEDLHVILKALANSTLPTGIE